MQADHTNRGYYPFGMGSAKNPYAQDDRKEAFNLYGACACMLMCTSLTWLAAASSPCMHLPMAHHNQLRMRGIYLPNPWRS